ncbi:MAG: DUF2062 domain-containing protein [Gemmatimonadaceae bacterium]
MIAPIVGQLRQGITAEKIALTIALGLVIGIFPILGATTVLCAIAAARLRLNQPIIQLVNYLAYPAQLLTLLPFYRAGETLFGRPHLPLSIPMLVERFRDDTGKFFGDFGMIAVAGVVVWCFVAPLLAGALYFGLRSPIRGLATRVRGTAPAKA